MQHMYNYYITGTIKISRTELSTILQHKTFINPEKEWVFKYLLNSTLNCAFTFPRLLRQVVKCRKCRYQHRITFLKT